MHVYGVTILFSFCDTLGTDKSHTVECVQGGEGFSLTCVGLMLFYQYKKNPKTTTTKKQHSEDAHKGEYLWLALACKLKS